MFDVDKKVLFDEIDALDTPEESTDGQVDTGLEESVVFLRNSLPPRHVSSDPPGSSLRDFAQQNRNRPSYNGPSISRIKTSELFLKRLDSGNSRSASPHASPPSIVRSTSAPNPSLGSTNGNAASNNMSPKKQPSLQKSASTTVVSSAVPSSSRPTSATGKRKRVASAPGIPENQQVLKGTMLYFIPNNDISPVRRAKIEKAQAYGGKWVRDWCPEVTHIVVDDNVNFQYLLKHLKFTELPPNVFPVNGNYVPECIRRKRLFKPTQKHYLVKGYDPSELSKSNLPASSAESEKSLQLKVDRGRISETGPDTLRSDEDSNIVAGAGNLAKIPSTYPQAYPDSSDALRGGGDDIEETHCDEFSMKLKSSMSRPDDDPANGDYNDALSQIINETKAAPTVDVVPYSSDEVEVDADESVSESERPPKARKLQIQQSSSGAANWQDKFQCMQKSEGQSSITENPNGRTIEVLQDMADHYGSGMDGWRLIAYRRAISALRKCTHKISTKAEAQKLQGVGTSIAEKIEEIVWTDKLQKLDNFKSDSTDIIIRLFLKIYGCGYVKAREWQNAGYKTLDDLLQHASLTKNQRIGIEHYEDFDTRIPREEVTAHGEVVRKALRRIDPEVQIEIMGSYRRGAKDSGDIDFMITKPNTSADCIAAIVFDILVPALTESGFLVATLATSRNNEGSKWHGASLLPSLPEDPYYQPRWRRMDFLVVPETEWGASLIYFTGNDIFNRSIRLLASKKGMRLNQRGLYRDVLRGRGREKITEGTLVEGRSEKKIFEILGVPWRPPHHRIC